MVFISYFVNIFRIIPMFCHVCLFLHIYPVLQVGNGFLFGVNTVQWHHTYLTAAHTFRVEHFVIKYNNYALWLTDLASILCWRFWSMSTCLISCFNAEFWRGVWFCQATILPVFSIINRTKVSHFKLIRPSIVWCTLTAFETIWNDFEL